MGRWSLVVGIGGGGGRVWFLFICILTRSVVDQVYFFEVSNVVGSDD